MVLLIRKTKAIKVISENYTHLRTFSAYIAYTFNRTKCICLLHIFNYTIYCLMQAFNILCTHCVILCIYFLNRLVYAFIVYLEISCQFLIQTGVDFQKDNTHWFKNTLWYIVMRSKILTHTLVQITILRYKRTGRLLKHVRIIQ